MENKKYLFWIFGVLFLWILSVSFILYLYFYVPLEHEEEITEPTPEVSLSYITITEKEIETVEVEVEVIRYATEKENIEHREDEIIALCKTVWGEAKDCSLEQKAAVVWCILNRVEDPRFPNDIISVLTQQNQFDGYSPNFPVTDSIYTLVNDVLNRWYIEDDVMGDVGRVLPKEYCWFLGNGSENVFRDAYSGSYNIWNWSLESPYKED